MAPNYNNNKKKQGLWVINPHFNYTQYPSTYSSNTLFVQYHISLVRIQGMFNLIKTVLYLQLMLFLCLFFLQREHLFTSNILVKNVSKETIRLFISKQMDER